MKRIFGISVPAVAIIAAAGLCCSADADYVVDSWTAFAPQHLRAPLMIDTVDACGESYSPLELINNRSPRNVRKAGGGIMRSVDADTSGYLSLEYNPADLQLLEYSVPVRAEFYTEGKLKVTSPLPMVLYVNGEQKKESLGGKEETVTLPIKLEPQADVDLTLMLLSQPSDSMSRSFKAIFEPSEGFEDVAVVSGPEMKRRFSLNDTEYGSRVTNMSLSPDGRWLLTHISDRHESNKTDRTTTLTDMHSGKVTLLNPLEAVQWMPVSNRLSIAVKNDGLYDIYIADPGSGERKLVAEGLPENVYEWDPSERLIFFSSEDKGKVEKGPLRRYTSPDDRIPGNRDLTYVMMMDPSTGLLQRITRGMRNSWIADFHPTEPKLLIMTSTVNPREWPFDEKALYEYDYTTGVTDTIMSNTGFLSSASYSPDGSQLLVVASAQEFGGIADRSNAPIANTYDMQLFLLNPKTGAVEALTADFDPSADGHTVWNKADGLIYLLATKGFGNRVYSLNPKNRRISELPLEIENISSFSMGDRGSRLAYTGMSRNHSGEGRVYDLKSHKDISVSDPNANRLAAIEMSEFERWTFKSSDGTEIEGYAILPPDFNPEKKYPLIVYYYGGTLPTQFSLTSPYNPQLAASRGYVVYMLNPSGTVGYGQEFSARHVNAWGKRTADDIIEGTKKFVEEHPYVDAEKIGCIGASYGGFMTQYLQTLTDIFAAAVSHAGISDVTSYWGEGYWGYSYNAVAAAKSYPWQNPDLFTKQGSLFNADKIHTPLLLLHGTADTNVPPGESIQLFNALRILGREVELVTVEGENHFIRTYDKRKQWNDTYMAWFAKWLQGDSRWWDSLYP